MKQKKPIKNKRKARKSIAFESDAPSYFLPDWELLTFAEYFSDNYKKLRVGEYFSNTKKYHIKYMARIKDKYPDTGKLSMNPMRFSRRTGIIEADKFILKNKKYTPNFVEFLILWCIVCKEQNGDFIKTDEITLEYYLGESAFQGTEKRTKENILKGYYEMLRNNPTELNVIRYKKIFQIINNAKWHEIKRPHTIAAN